MSTEAQISKRPLRLNPFVFPSDTDSYFVLLVASVIGVSLFIYNVLYNTIPGNWEHSQFVQAQCAATAQAASLAHPDILDVYSDTFKLCMMPEDFNRAVFMLGGVLFLFAGAGLIYWMMPNWRIWRNKLEPISKDGDPKLIAYLANLCRDVGLSAPPAFVWDPLANAVHGLAFGHLGRYYVYLPGGFVDKYYNDEPIFRSELLHELSHLQNKDIDKTYLTFAIWWAFVAVALIPFIIGQPYAIGHLGKAWGSLFSQGWRLLALTAFIFLTGCAVLRSREMYADVLASVWDGPKSALRRSLEALSPHAKGRWQYMLGFHPDPRQRCQLLDDTDRLFDMSFWTAFSTGIAATIAYSGIPFLLGLITPPSLILYYLDYFGAALVFAPLVVGVVGVGVWRTTFAQLAKGKPLHGAGRLGLGVGLGAILGQILNLFSISQFSSSDILWCCVMLFSMFLFFRWVGMGAAIWLDVAATQPLPRLTYRLGLLLAGGFLTLWFAFLYYNSPYAIIGFNEIFLAPLMLRDALGLGSFLGSSDIVKLSPYIAFVYTPFTIIGFIILWGYPLAAWFWRKQVAASSGASWAFLDQPRQALKWSSQGDLRLGLASRVGLIGGLLFCLLSFVVSLIIQKAAYSGSFPIELFVNWVSIWQAALAALLQAGVAAVTAIQVKRLGMLHGLFSSLVAACVMMIGAFVIYVVISDRPLSYYMNSFPYGTTLGLTAAIINGGTFLALPALLGIFLIGRLHRSIIPRA